MTLKSMTLILATLGCMLHAQSYVLKSISLNAGGTSRLASGTYVIGCSIGQAVAGSVTNSFTAYLGYWTPTTFDPGIEESSELYELGHPAVCRLYQNYPNPVSYRTAIKYEITTFCKVNLRLFDVAGRQVASLVDETQKPGCYQVTWDIGSVSKGRLTNGVYFYRLEAGTFLGTRKLIVCR